MPVPDYPENRREQYLSKIATGDGDIPAYPENREEQYLDEIARNGGGGGGGGSSGGVLVATLDMSTGTLDKTWQEIFDAGYPVITALFGENDKGYMTIVEVLVDTEFEPATYLVNAVVGDNNLQFMADSADGYPVMQQDGGGD